ncbi:hypothetical protein D3C81_892550 [compost metagenome]
MRQKCHQLEYVRNKILPADRKQCFIEFWLQGQTDQQDKEYAHTKKILLQLVFLKK